MRIGTSRADRIGFAVVVVLASLLAVLLVTNPGNDPTQEAQGIATFADTAPDGTASDGTASAAAPAAVPTTAAIALPEPTATAAPVEIAPAALPEVDVPEEVLGADAEASAADSSDAAGSSDETAAASASTSTATTESAAAAPAPTATEVPNPQLPEDAAVPNPQLPDDAAVPNPQPGTQTIAAAPANVPADAPQGGTFTRTLSATVNGQIPLFSSPGGAQFMPTFNGTALPASNPTVFGNNLVYRVLAGEPGDSWAKVYVPARPNNTTAWVQTSQFQWGSSNRMIQINVSTNTVTVFEGSNVLLTTAAVTGKSSSPTPLAQGWVEETMAGPSSAYGPVLISLGIFSDALNSFGGGVPKVALHGTSSPGLMGQYASNGCIRVRNEIITQIAGLVNPGSKVIITG